MRQCRLCSAVVMSDVESETPDLKTLINELFSVRQKWYPIGVQLNVDHTVLEDIETKHAGDVYRQLSSMLQEWLKNGSKTASWREIVEALRSPSVDTTSLASNLKINKCPKDDEDFSAGKDILA